MDARSLIILEDSRDLGTLRKDFRKSCKSASGSSLKRSKKAVHKRVVTVPIGNLEGSRQKGETPPPPDSWTWRKYGQKPIKGSPYPRGYYRCSSSKGCPARKQVERSHLDPTMLSVTYSSDHNHPLTETSRVPHHAGIAENFSPPEEPKKPEPTPELDVDAVKFELDGSKLMGHDPGWFSDMEDSVLLPETLEIEDAEHRCFKNDSGYSGGSGGREFDDHEDFFADLGELPESTVVFRWMGS